MTSGMEPDGIADEVSARIRGNVRIAVALGATMAENIAKERERWARVAQQTAGTKAAEARRMWEADRAFAVGRLSQVVRDEWWDRATPADIHLAWQDAAAWRDHDPTGQAARYAERIREQLQARYGVDPDGTPAREPVDLAQARARREHVYDQVEATVAVAVTESAAERSTSPGPDRSRVLAEELRRDGVPVEAAEGLLLASVARGRASVSARPRGRDVAPARPRSRGRAGGEMSAGR